MLYTHSMKVIPLSMRAGVHILNILTAMPEVECVGVVVKPDVITFMTSTDDGYRPELDAKITEVIQGASAAVRDAMIAAIREMEECDTSPDREMPNFVAMDDAELLELHTQWFCRAH